MSIETADIEKLATLFADKVKELTPSALDLASQMYVLNGFQDLIATVIFGGIAYVFWLVFCYCREGFKKDEWSNFDFGMVLTATLSAISGGIGAVSLGMALSNFLNSYFPAAALLKELIK